MGILPPGIGLRDWVSARIADDVTVKWDDQRACTVIMLTESFEQDVMNDIVEDSQLDHSTGYGTRDPAEHVGSERHSRKRRKTEDGDTKLEKFLSGFPAD